MSAVRPGTASHLKSAQIQSRGGTASRLASGAKADARNRAVNGSALNTIVCVEDRPITQQGTFHSFLTVTINCKTRSKRA